MKRSPGNKDIFTIPNVLSFFRILLIPQIVWLCTAGDNSRAAVAAVAVSALTDAADGFIARRFHMISDLGKVLDPIADKLTQAAVLICLALRYPFVYWVFGLLCLKEVLQGLLGLAVVKATGSMQQARWYGKVSTVVFYLTMLLLLLELPEPWVLPLTGLCAAALMLAMVLYVREWLDVVWSAVFRVRSRHSLIMRLFMLLMWAAFIVFCWFHRDRISVDGMLRVTPRSEVLAVVMMMGLFALKSASVVIHSGLVYALSGILFPLPAAVAVNLLGTVLMASLSYGAGRRLGGEGIDEFVSRNRNAELLYRFRRNNAFVCTALTRFVNLLPFDVVSACFGATETPFLPYMLGTLAGMAASCVLFPLIGAYIVTPGSPRFLAPAILEAAILLAGLLALLIVNRREGKDTEAA